ncbi:hypothetical protein [Pectinatus frisingensis]|uniref:hypothetical protein n=1 Tax=Pectinatus frisingensis TaxID=865 RepID=UPI0018C6992E|nr:hypothetical protein [Pectinatus frisingensis]
MQQALSAIKYATHAGYQPYIIKDLCNKGIIPHIKRGKNYYIRPDIADKALLAYEGNYQSEQTIKKAQPLKQKTVFNFLNALKKV